MDSSDYLRLAAKCELEARRVSNPEAKLFFYEITKRFFRAAETLSWATLRRHSPYKPDQMC